jgi:hypothetical protein
MVMARWLPWKRSSHRAGARERAESNIPGPACVYIAKAPGQFTCFMYICFHLMLGAPQSLRTPCTRERICTRRDKEQKRLLRSGFSSTLCVAVRTYLLLLLSAPLRRLLFKFREQPERAREREANFADWLLMRDRTESVFAGCAILQHSENKTQRSLVGAALLSNEMLITIRLLHPCLFRPRWLCHSPI